LSLKGRSGGSADHGGALRVRSALGHQLGLGSRVPVLELAVVMTCCSVLRHLVAALCDSLAIFACLENLKDFGVVGWIVDWLQAVELSAFEHCRRVLVVLGNS
jgi:hypothetical protein